jgi:hypothetical protein
MWKTVPIKKNSSSQKKKTLSQNESKKLCQKKCHCGKLCPIRDPLCHKKCPCGEVYPIGNSPCHKRCEVEDCKKLHSIDKPCHEKCSVCRKYYTPEEEHDPYICHLIFESEREAEDIINGSRYYYDPYDVPDNMPERCYCGDYFVSRSGRDCCGTC